MTEQAGQQDSHIAEEGCSKLSRQNKDLKDGTSSKQMAEGINTKEATTRIPGLQIVLKNGRGSFMFFHFKTYLFIIKTMYVQYRKFGKCRQGKSKL